MQRVMISRRFLLAGFAGLTSTSVRAQQMDITRATAFLQAASQQGTVRIIIDAGPTGVADRIVGLLRALPVPLSVNPTSA